MGFILLPSWCPYVSEVRISFSVFLEIEILAHEMFLNDVIIYSFSFCSNHRLSFSKREQTHHRASLSSSATSMLASI